MYSFSNLDRLLKLIFCIKSFLNKELISVKETTFSIHIHFVQMLKVIKTFWLLFIVYKCFLYLVCCYMHKFLE